MSIADTPSWISAGASVVSAITALVLTGVAFVQIKGLRAQLELDSQQEHRRNTLQAILRAENDPILQEAYKEVLRYAPDSSDYSATAACRFHVIGILNYFEGIAIGIDQGIYIETMAKEYLAPVLQKAVEIWLLECRENTKCPRGMFFSTDFTPVRKLYTRWFTDNKGYRA